MRLIVDQDIEMATITLSPLRTNTPLYVGGLPGQSAEHLLELNHYSMLVGYEVIRAIGLQSHSLLGFNQSD